MSKTFRRGDHVEWNSEAGRVRGVILKKVVSNVRFKGYVHHASKAEPQYFIASDKTDHIAIHKGQALRLIRPPSQGKAKQSNHEERKGCSAMDEHLGPGRRDWFLFTCSRTVSARAVDQWDMP